MSNQSPPPFSKFLHPRHWSTWAGIGLLFIIAWLPFRLRVAAGTLLGWLTWSLARERRYITTINIHLCFPELTEEAQQDLIKRTFIENGIGLIETATGWMRSTAQSRELELRFLPSPVWPWLGRSWSGGVAPRHWCPPGCLPTPRSWSQTPVRR